jgi:subtilisin family serine protease
MRGFSWKLSPEDFVIALQRRRAEWARYGGQADRRAVRQLTSSRVRWFKQRTGVTRLPQLASQSATPLVWRTVDAGSVAIVFFPEPNVGALSGTTGRAIEPSRKRAKRALRSIAQIDGENVFELLASRRTDNDRLPVIGQAYIDKHNVRRSIFLEAIGAAIVPNLSAEQADALEDQGAIVLSNELTAIVDPTLSPVTAEGNAEVRSKAWHLTTINVASARSKKLDGKGVSIGVLDTGIDAKHPEFAGQTVVYRSFSPAGVMQTSKVPKDYGEHGTHVSALCVGANVGIAPGATLAVAAVLTQKNSKGLMAGYTAQILAGMNWLAQGGDGLSQGVDILNASLGDALGASAYYGPVSGHSLAGALVVAAIGNEGSKGFGKHSAPAMFDCVLAVGATTANDDVADFSAWGQGYSPSNPTPACKPDIMAPGEGIVSAIPNGRYAAMDGTSMACPIISGAAALLMQQNAAFKGNPQDVIQHLYRLTRKLQGTLANADARRHGQGCLDLTAI